MPACRRSTRAARAACSTWPCPRSSPSDRLVYLSFSEPGEGGAGTAVARGRLAENALENVEVIWRQTPKVAGPNHWGSRLVFARDGTLFVTTGDRYSYRDRAQDLSDDDRQGRADQRRRLDPGGQPVRQARRRRARRSGRTAIATCRARRSHPSTGQLWTVEHGARGGDELNHPQPGRNYGWPVITYGVDYSGVEDRRGHGEGGHGAAGLLLGSGDRAVGCDVLHRRRYPGWKGSLFVGSLTPGGLVRLELDGDRVRKEERYLGDVGRVRDVVQGPDGLLYLLIDARNGEHPARRPATGRIVDKSTTEDSLVSRVRSSLNN